MSKSQPRATSQVHSSGKRAGKLSAWCGGNWRTILIASLLSNLLLCALLFDPKPHTGGDNASYVILAQSILRIGDGYSQSIGPGPVQPHTQYPFGYPLLLSPMVALFGANFAVLKLLSIAFSLLSVLLFALIMRQSAVPLTAAAATLAFALNPILVDYSHWVLTEEAFLCFSLLALYFLVLSTRDGASRFGWTFWLAVLSLVFTAHIRSIGVAFVGGGVAYYLLRRQWKVLAVFILAVAVLMAPWNIRNRIASAGQSEVAGAFMLKNPYSPEEGTIGPSDLAARVGRNMAIYGAGESARVVLGSESPWLVNPASRVLAVAVSLLVIAGLIGRIVTNGPGMLEAYFGFFLGIVLIWPDAWSDVRFIMPLIPLMLFYLAESASLAVRFTGRFREHGPVVTAVFLMMIAALSFSAQFTRVPSNLRMLSAWAGGDRYAGYPVNWRRFFEAADWVRQNTPEDAVITVRKPSLGYLWTGRRVDGYPFTTDTDSVLAQILRTDYVIVDQISGTTVRYLVPAIQKQQNRFKAVYRTADPATWVLEVIE